jgi:hypothetical protein
MPEKHTLKAEPGSYEMKGNEATFLLILKIAKKNWLMIGIWIVFTVSGIVSEIPHGWFSVGFAIVIIIITFVVGSRMTRQFIKR